MNKRNTRAILNAGQLVTLIVALIGLTLSVAHLNDVNTSRRRAAVDSCYLLRGLVYAATTHAPKQRAAATAYIDRTPLRNCTVYARRVVKP